MKRFIVTFAYDVPHYLDFAVEAESAETAEAIARAKLEAGELDRINHLAKASYEDQSEERIFSHGEQDDEEWPTETLDELLEENQ